MYTSCATSRGTSRFAHHIHEGIPTYIAWLWTRWCSIHSCGFEKSITTFSDVILFIYFWHSPVENAQRLTHSPRRQDLKVIIYYGREGAAVFHPCAYITTHKILQFFKLGPVQASINITFCASNKKTDRQCENCFYLIRNCVLFQWAIFCLFFVISVILYY